jgi:hypothetical protein
LDAFALFHGQRQTKIVAVIVHIPPPPASLTVKVLSATDTEDASASGGNMDNARIAEETAVSSASLATNTLNDKLLDLIMKTVQSNLK